MANIKTKKILSREKKNLIFYAIVMAYPVLQFCVFYIGVNFNSVMLAFKEYVPGEKFVGVAYDWVMFKQFGKVINDFISKSSMQTAFFNSLKVYAVQTVVSSTLTLFFSYYIYKKKWASSFFRIVLFLPSVISPLVLAIMFKNFANSAIPGYLNSIFGTDVPALLTNADTRFGTLLFYMVWVSFGTSILLYNGAMSGIDVSVTEAAKMDGATGVKEFVYIVFPLIFSTFSTFFIVSLAAMFINQFHLFSIYGERADVPVQTMGYYLFLRVSKAGLSDYPYLSAMGLLMTFIAVPLTLGVKKLFERFGPKTE